MVDGKKDFEVIFSTKIDEDTTIITSSEQISNDWMMSALQAYDPTNSQYSAYLKDGSSSSDEITPEYIAELAGNAQNDIKKIQTINALVRNEINKNDIVGKTVECIETNINTEIKIMYNINGELGKIKTKQLMDVKNFILGFNKAIDIKGLIRRAVSTTYAEGTFVMYLRPTQTGNYVIDYYPIGICEVSDYDFGGKPVVLLNINELRTRLQKTYKKNKKNKPLFFKDIDEEVKANFPSEVYEAFKNKDEYAILDTRYCKVIRIGNLNRRYGITPIFRALEPLSMLYTFGSSDRVNSKAKAKKIIHQKLRKEVMGQDYNRKGFEEMAYAHSNLMKAWKQSTVLVTTPPTVESISYVEPKIEMTNIDTVNSYRSRVLSTLGIGFLMDNSSQTVSTANISVTQLMRTINKISEQLETAIQQWYYQILEDNNLHVEYCPEVKVIDSEQLEIDMKIELATFLYNTLNASLETCYQTVGLSLVDEAEKRKYEQEQGYTELFIPRATAYTFSGNKTDDEGGRPEADNKNDGKQKYDKERQKSL